MVIRINLKLSDSAYRELQSRAVAQRRRVVDEAALVLERAVAADQRPVDRGAEPARAPA